MSETNSLETLPCGCRMGRDEEADAFVFMPHAKSCEYYIYVQEESARQGKPLVTIGSEDDLPD